MLKKKHDSLLPLRVFFQRILYNLTIGLAILTFSLGVGMLGYCHFENMSIVDAYENAAMILSGMGPVDTLKTVNGKIFAGTYAIFSGVIFLIVIAIIVAPIFHRLFHRFLIKDDK